MERQLDFEDDATRIGRHPDIVWTDTDSEVMMLNVERSAYHCLNATGRRVWMLLEVPRTMAELVRALSAKFDVAPEACRADVARFMRALVGAGLVTIIDS